PVPLASLSAIIAYFFFHVSAHPPSLHSFPTRRSSDLGHRSAHGTTSSSTTPTPSPTGPAGAAHPRAGPSTTGSGFPSAHPAAPPHSRQPRPDPHDKGPRNRGAPEDREERAAVLNNQIIITDGNVCARAKRNDKGVVDAA